MKKTKIHNVPSITGRARYLPFPEKADPLKACSYNPPATRSPAAPNASPPGSRSPPPPSDPSPSPSSAPRPPPRPPPPSSASKPTTPARKTPRKSARSKKVAVPVEETPASQGDDHEANVNSTPPEAGAAEEAKGAKEETREGSPVKRAKRTRSSAAKEVLFGAPSPKKSKKKTASA
eukprot:CAMPEP_0174908858 /NCGR_PEP_ID=MMETSP0167-20121228/66049_1 /TAXON_ID=38298 /ORGANISM="Rhodella maculata, Strain CCMP736" /LENGTH=176 /DNA_ID=CAMNT_0016152701 /DNA_START=31 /DNA_END=559 /DNA_ORIENTATION=-